MVEARKKSSRRLVCRNALKLMTENEDKMSELTGFTVWMMEAGGISLNNMFSTGLAKGNHYGTQKCSTLHEREIEHFRDASGDRYERKMRELQEAEEEKEYQARVTKLRIVETEVVDPGSIKPSSWNLCRQKGKQQRWLDQQ